MKKKSRESASAESSGRPEKARIYYNREYRYFRSTPFITILYNIFTIIPMWLIVYFGYSAWSKWLSGIEVDIIQGIFRVEAAMKGRHSQFVYGRVYYFDMKGNDPNFTICFFVLIACLFAMSVLLQKFTKYKPLMIYIVMILGITSASSIFYIIVPDRYPYELSGYANMYMSQEGVFVYMLAIIVALSISLLPGVHTNDFLTFYIIMAYAVVYGSVRYLVFTTLLYMVTNMFMATFYFMLGIFIDLLYVVAIYAIYVKHISELYSENEEQLKWKWS